MQSAEALREGGQKNLHFESSIINTLRIFREANASHLGTTFQEANEMSLAVRLTSLFEPQYKCTKAKSKSGRTEFKFHSHIL